jgi:ATP-dependent RNA helicase DeaD
MGREGIAFTFVSPEEGPQLTRIEIRIERLLKRDEIEGFEAFDRRPKPAPVERIPTGGFEKAAADAAGAAGTPEEPKRPPAATLLGKGRGPKRHRRAL